MIGLEKLHLLHHQIEETCRQHTDGAIKQTHRGGEHDYKQIALSYHVVLIYIYNNNWQRQFNLLITRVFSCLVILLFSSDLVSQAVVTGILLLL